jgi:hypothetical protein
MSGRRSPRLAGKRGHTSIGKKTEKGLPHRWAKYERVLEYGSTHAVLKSSPHPRYTSPRARGAWLGSSDCRPFPSPNWALGLMRESPGGDPKGAPGPPVPLCPHCPGPLISAESGTLSPHRQHPELRRCYCRNQRAVQRADKLGGAPVQHDPECTPLPGYFESEGRRGALPAAFHPCAPAFHAGIDSASSASSRWRTRSLAMTQHYTHVHLALGKRTRTQGHSCAWVS